MLKFARVIFCVFLFGQIYNVSNILSSDGFNRFLKLKTGFIAQILNPQPNFFGKTVESKYWTVPRFNKLFYNFREKLFGRI
jgi:hypothetical protein